MLRSFLTLAGAFLTSSLFLFPSMSWAQERVGSKASSPLPNFKTERVGDARLDVSTGQVRALYEVAEKQIYRDAERFIREEADQFGWKEEGDEFVVVEDERRDRSRHVTFQQTFKGIPVAGRTVRVNLDRMGRVSMVTSAYEAVLASEDDFDVLPTVRAADATRVATLILASGDAHSSEPRLVIANPESPRLAWELTVWPDDEPAEYRVWVDAHTSDILFVDDQALENHSGHDHHHHGHIHRIGDKNPTGSKQTDGSGYAFDPDPLFASGASYGPPFTDNNDLTSAELDAARTTVTLRDISQDDDGKWILQGPFVQIVGHTGHRATVYDPPAMDAPTDFFFDRSDKRFEAVNVYYHIDKNQRYIQSLGILDIQDAGLEVNPHGLTSDQSFYFPDRNMIIYGSGGVDDAEDPSVILHEYGHAVLNAAAPGLLASTEGRALHEGFADYWQGTYYRHLVETGQTGRNDWRWVFLWDSGEGTIWPGRYLDNQGIYPQDVCVASTNGSGCSVHQDGTMWATTLMEVYDDLGRTITDHLVLLSHYYLSAPVTFADAAQAVVQADFDYYDGAHVSTLIEVFAARGLVSVFEYGPVIAHEPLLSIEQSGISIPVVAEVQGFSSDIATVEVTWSSRDVATQTASLSPTGSNRFEGQLQLPATPDTVFYYLSARDAIGNVTFKPTGAPQEQHFFLVGTDEEAPTVGHQALTAATFLDWPVVVEGSAQDNFGLESVELNWELFNPDGAAVSSGSATLAEQNGSFSLDFPIPISDLENGSQVAYYIAATDASTRKNVTRVPENGVFTFEVTAGGVLRAYSFDGTEEEVSLGGEWAAAAPEFGMRVSPAAGDVLVTRAGASYSDQPSTSVAELPALNLSRTDPVHLRFWHFFDTEADGFPDPVGTGGNFHDGGVLQVRTSTDPEWRVLAPVGGYPGTLLASGQNPLEGFSAFGGFSQGWRRVSAALPQEDGVQVRFVFATDQGNTGNADRFAGWMIDGVSIGSSSDIDQAEPAFSDVPEAFRFLSTTAALPTIETVATDDLGIQDAWMEWQLVSSGASESGTARMSQHPDDLKRFSVETDFLLAPEPGSELAFNLRVRDVAGHEQTTGPFSIRFRLFGSYDALSSVWTSGNWEAQEEGWVYRTRLANALSGLVLDPRDTETNAQALTLVVDHEPMLTDGAAGLLELTIDEGATWLPLEPEGGYPGTARLEPGNPLDGRSAFVGPHTRTESVFDLSPWIGEQVQVRFLATSEGHVGDNYHWRLFSAQFNAQTDNAAFEQASEFELQDAYPNPFVEKSRLTWSLEEAGPVTIEIYDSIGRRVATVVDGNFEAGSHAVTWDAPGTPAGVYFVRLQSGGRQATQTLVRVAR